MPLFEKLDDNAILPVRKTKGSAGYDLYSIETKRIRSVDYGTMPTEFRTGLKVNIPEGYCGQIWCKSSLGVDGLVVHAGLIDSDYAGELIVLLSSLYDDMTIKAGGKLAQIVIVPYYSEDDIPVDEIRVGGFGSTDKPALSEELPVPIEYGNISMLEPMIAAAGPL